MRYIGWYRFLAAPLVLAMIMAVSVVLPVAADGETVISVTPQEQEIAAGEPFTVEILVDPGVAVAGMQFDLSFNPALVTVNNVEAGDLLGQSGSSIYFLPGAIDNGAGTIIGVAGVITTQGEAVASQGSFAIITLTAGTTAGISALDLANVIVGDITANAVSIVINDGSISVQGGGDVVTGVTGEANCAIVPGATVTLYDGVTPVATTVSEGDGIYSLSVPGAGDYDVTVSKTGYKDETHSINIGVAGQEYVLDMIGETGMVPAAATMAYVLECVNHWLYPPGDECDLSMAKVLATVNAWLYPT